MGHNKMLYTGVTQLTLTLTLTLKLKDAFHRIKNRREYPYKCLYHINAFFQAIFGSIVFYKNKYTKKRNLEKQT